MAVNDEDFLHENTRVRVAPDGTFFLEAVILEWTGACSFKTSWDEAKRYPPSTSSDDLEKARRALLRTHRYFGLCKECHQRQLRGAMYERTLCMACAPAARGVVF